MFRRIPIESKKSKLPSIILGIFVVILVITGSCIHGFISGYENFKVESIIDQDQIIKVESGETFTSLGKKLGLNETYMKLYLKYNQPDFELQVGNYKASQGSNLNQVFESLQKPVYEEIKVTLLEGWNIFDIDNYLTKKGLLEKGEFIKYSEEDFYDLKKDYSFIADVETLEGFLYPDTYNIDVNNFSPEILARKMLTNFDNKVISKLGDNYGSIEIIDIVNLASIVEKEERSSKNRPIVAGILKKRLDEGWMIGADITVCYPYRLTSEECKLVVTKYINKKNKYNTRTMTGLPMTPIGNPTFESIDAVINSKDTPYYYYLHDIKTGKIYYGITNADHERNKSLYLR